jgi:hypothetical protein
MNIINENNEKSKRYLPHELHIRENAVKTYRNGNSISYVCRKYHISRTSLYRWNKQYDGTKESLKDKSHRPLSKHPNAHTDEEITWIRNLIRRNPDITLCELWYKLRIKRGYSRHIGSLYRVLKRLDFYKEINVKNTSKYVPKKYDTPNQLEIKWQIDVKFVSICCHSNKIPEDKKFYQYTCIDEASRERFLFWYDEHTPFNIVDFVKRCISYYEYKTPLEKNNPILIGSFLSKFLFHIIYKYTKQSLLGLCLYLFNYLLKPYFLLNLSTCPFLAVLLCVPV